MKEVRVEELREGDVVDFCRSQHWYMQNNPYGVKQARVTFVEGRDFPSAATVTECGVPDDLVLVGFAGHELDDAFYGDLVAFQRGTLFAVIGQTESVGRG